MNKIRYLALLLCCLMGCMVAVAQDSYNPASPDEPGMPPRPLTLLVEPANAGAARIQMVVPETQITITATSYTSWKFTCWTSENGDTVATTSSFKHVKQDCAETFTAHYVYTPEAPTEPQPGTTLVYYRLDVVAGYGGTASGGGRYQADTKVTVSASASTGFKFVGWYNEAGQQLSASASYAHTKQVGNETLTARFAFDPTAPDEPADPILNHTLTIVSTDGGNATPASCRALEGTRVSCNATPNAGYQFDGWYIGDNLLSQQRSLSYTIGRSDVTLTARFVFNPTAPDEPIMPLDNRYSLYWLSPITYPGHDVECCLYLSNLSTLNDLRFDLTFPTGMMPDIQTAQLSATMQGYTASVAPTDEPNAYTVLLQGGSVGAGNQEIMRFHVAVPDTTAANANYQLYINQVSVTQQDGTTCTMRTRNGRVSVYLLGDTNGDGEVNILDRINMVNFVGEGDTERDDFIKEVSDVNEDGDFSILDVIAITDLIANQ